MGLANYGFTDGSGEWYITVDSDKCDNCGECVRACPRGLLEIVLDDYDEQVVAVKEEFWNNVKYLCALCRPAGKGEYRPCARACRAGAITHSW